MHNKILKILIIAIIAISGLGQYARAAEKEPKMATSGNALADDRVTAQNQEVIDNNKDGSIPNRFGKNENAGPSPSAQTRRSRVANAVQKMLQFADREDGIGERVKTIAGEQNQRQERIDQALEKLQSRNRLVKFFLGPDYGALDTLDSDLAEFSGQIDQLKEYSLSLADQSDKDNLKEQVAVLEQVKNEAESDALAEKKTFSLFGWLVKLLKK